MNGWIEIHEKERERAFQWLSVNCASGAMKKI